MNDPSELGGVQWGAVLPGLLLALVGAAAYLGVVKQFWRGVWPSPTLGFGMLWLGGAAVAIGLLWPVLDTPWGLVPGLAALAAGVVGLVSIVWMARPLQPRWYREETRR